jgi:hypothetical protein
MQSYIKGEISITAAQLKSAKAIARKKMRAACRDPARHSRCFELDDVFGFVFNEAMAYLGIYMVEDSICDEDASRLIVLSLDESWDLSDRQALFWKLRFRDGCSPETLDALVDELLDESLKFLSIKVIKATRKNTTAPLRRAA